MSVRSKRERLTDAAAELFWLKGYAATSIADLAKKADVPVGNVYYYFKSKAELAVAVAEVFVAATEEALAQIENSSAYSVDADALSAFFAMLEKSHASRSRHGCPLARAVSEFGSESPVAAQLADKPFQLLIEFLSKILAKGGHPRAMQAADEAVASWQGAIIVARTKQSPQLLAQICRSVEDRLRKEILAGQSKQKLL